MALWEQILVGAIVVLVLLWVVPGLRGGLARSRQATADDWRGLLLPLGAVILFVILLISLAAG